MKLAPSGRRPRIVTALSVFFFVGSVIACVTAIALHRPGTVLDTMWLLNPRAHEGFASIGPKAAALMLIVSVACLFASFGLWNARRWGYFLAIGLLLVNFFGDLANGLLGVEPRALVGVPIVIILVALLSRRHVRRYFLDSSRRNEH